MEKESEQLIENLPHLEKEVYQFMQHEYAKLEEAGEKHDVAANDIFVEKKVSEKFNISEEEAGNIYAKVESQLSRFNEYRASK
ncbi:hypothetical protein D7Z54_27125 [Salibacterium salarium]|uniref:Uncharacterized protein n=1 Tax=Salibacterium salarium TaxID=284579 RepID=A0A428MVJ6_9BACI|nr:hypothetical protein [Salibacterium salarium]RSL30168.1 hypothetical protein D7Z54_27125 [Salibacterium salarium]